MRVVGAWTRHDAQHPAKHDERAAQRLFLKQSQKDIHLKQRDLALELQAVQCSALVSCFTHICLAWVWFGVIALSIKLKKMGHVRHLDWLMECNPASTFFLVALVQPAPAPPTYLSTTCTYPSITGKGASAWRFPTQGSQPAVGQRGEGKPPHSTRRLNPASLLPTSRSCPSTPPRPKRKDKNTTRPAACRAVRRKARTM